MSKEVSRSLHKANLIKAYLWGVREGLVKSHFLDFIHGSLIGCHSAAELSDQDFCIVQWQLFSQGKVKLEEFSTRRPDPNLEGLDPEIRPAG